MQDCYRPTDRMSFQGETQGEPAEGRRRKIHPEDGPTARAYFNG